MNLSKGEKDSLELKIDITLWFILEKLSPIIALSITAISILVYVKLRRGSRRKKKDII